MSDPYILRIFESLLLGSVNNLAGLVDFVNDLRQVKENHFHIFIQQRKAMVHFCQILDLGVPDEFTLVPVNFPAVLLHWRILLVIIACLKIKTDGSCWTCILLTRWGSLRICWTALTVIFTSNGLGQR